MIPSTGFIQLGETVPRALVLSVLLVGAVGVEEKVVRLPGGAQAWVIDHHLELRRGKDRARVPLPADVTGLARVVAGPPLTLTLERICPPPLALTLTAAELEARFALANAQAGARQGRPADAIKQLGQALAQAPRATDVRLALARLQLDDKAEAAAAETLRGGLQEHGPEIFWAVLGDAKLRPLAGRLGLVDRPAGLVAGTEPPSSLAAWSPERSWFAAGQDNARLVIVDAIGAEVLALSLLSGADLDASGDVAVEARPRLARRLADLDRLLGAFGFRALDQAGAGAKETGDELSWLRWKDRGLVASAGGVSLRVRRAGRVVFEKAVETSGTIGLRWGHYLADRGLLLLAWSRRSGNSECPNGDGLVIVPLPAQ
jgi:hypothetical protein